MTSIPFPQIPRSAFPASANPDAQETFNSWAEMLKNTVIAEEELEVNDSDDQLQFSRYQLQYAGYHPQYGYVQYQR
jgi:hypothetical protein